MSITIRDVARTLGLSITTVSRALDGYDDVAEDTRQLVVRTAHEMGYVPNQAARQLRRQRADTIGYILPANTPRFSDPFFAEFIAGLGDEAAAHHFDLLISSAPPNTTIEQQAYERWTHGRRVDGLLINRIRQNDWRVHYLAQSGFPFVTLGRSLNQAAHPWVDVDNQRWFEMLVGHLAELGHRRIAYIGASADLVIQAERFAGYRAGLERHGLPFDPALVAESDLTAEGGYQAAERLLALDPPPTAIACIDDITAMGVLHAARENGYSVGETLAVAGFDGVIGSEHAQPPLTTVNQPVYQIARQMVQMLLAQIDGQSLSQPHVIIEAVLEIRTSTIGQRDWPP